MNFHGADVIWLNVILYNDIMTESKSENTLKPDGFVAAVHTYLRGAGQVMFQNSSWTGLFFLAGIFWGSYASGLPQVAWGAVVGTFASTVAGYFLAQKPEDGAQGLWGFNGILVGCAFPTFLSDTPLMWAALIFCAMLTTWIRRAFNNVMAPWKVNSLTFPFVFLTWLFLLASRYMSSIAPDALSHPELTETFHGTLDMGFISLIIYWLKGISQVFLVDNWVTGLLFLIGLAIHSRYAAAWAAAGSAIALVIAIIYGAPAEDISSGLFGFSPVLTAIAIGCTFYKPGIRSAVWSVFAIVATVFIQAGMDALMMPYGLPTLTGPFCVTTWLFLLPLYNLSDSSKVDHSDWQL